MKKLNKMILVALSGALIVGPTFAMSETDAVSDAPVVAPAVKLDTSPGAMKAMNKRLGSKKADAFKKQLKTLDLTDEQKEQIQKIFLTHAADMKQIKTDMMSNKKALHKLIAGDQYDPAKIKLLAQKMGADFEQSIIMRAEVKHEIKGVLTPPQLAELKQSMQEMKKNHHDKKGAHPGMKMKQFTLAPDAAATPVLS
jgi:Spy/CpxP family protein refolding chaperone